MNDAKISKLAVLRQLKFLRFLIVVGPSLKFPQGRVKEALSLSRNSIKGLGLLPFLSVN